MSGFTKGPWSVGGGCRATGFTVKIASGELLVGGAGLTSEANARLIAAAPELYEALESCELWFKQHSPLAPLINGLGDAEHPMLTMIRAALSKAAGEGV